jgi:hypothetical protein
MATSHNEMSLHAKEPSVSAPSMASRALALRRSGDNASNTMAQVSRTIIFRVPHLADGRYHIADPTPVSELAQLPAGLQFRIESRDKLCDDFPARSNYHFLAFPNPSQIRRQVVSQIRYVDLCHRESPRLYILGVQYRKTTTKGNRDR